MTVQYIPWHPKPRKGEVTLKQWCSEEAKRAGVTVSAIYNRYYSRRYRGLRVRKINNRVVFVKV